MIGFSNLPRADRVNTCHQSRRGTHQRVTARFTWTPCPAEQMSIDSDLNSGLIDGSKPAAAQSSHRAGFYGAMDGASRFARAMP